MKQNFHRNEQIGELLYRSLRLTLLQKTTNALLKKMRITDVAVNQNLTRAKIFYYVAEDEYSEIQKILTKAKGFLRAEISRTTKLRHTPELIFIYDKTPKTAAQIEALLKSGQV